MDARLKELFNAELSAQGQPLIDCGDEWTEMIERVDEVRVREGRLAALREVREMVREYKEHNNPDAPQLLSYAEDYVVDGILQRIDAMIAAIEEG